MSRGDRWVATMTAGTRGEGGWTRNPADRARGARGARGSRGGRCQRMNPLGWIQRIQSSLWQRLNGAIHADSQRGGGRERKGAKRLYGIDRLPAISTERNCTHVLDACQAPVGIHVLLLYLPGVNVRYQISSSQSDAHVLSSPAARKAAAAAICAGAP